MVARKGLTHESGQALILVVVVLVVLFGFMALAIDVGSLYANRRKMQNAADAGALALNLIYSGSVDAQFISDWDPAGDSIRYTHDDEPVIDLNAIPLIQKIIPRDIFYGIENLTNALVNISSSPSPINELFLVEGSQEMTVDLADLPAVEHLFTGAACVTVKSEAWLTWTEGIY